MGCVEVRVKLAMQVAQAAAGRNQLVGADRGYAELRGQLAGVVAQDGGNGEQLEAQALGTGVTQAFWQRLALYWCRGVLLTDSALLRGLHLRSRVQSGVAKRCSQVIRRGQIGL